MRSFYKRYLNSWMSTDIKTNITVRSCVKDHLQSIVDNKADVVVLIKNVKH